MNDVYVTAVGTLGADPVNDVRGTTSVTKFRMAHTPRRFDRDRGWGDGETTWFRVTAFGSLANHTVISLKKGQRVLVHGRLQVQEWRAEDGQTRRSVEIVAEAVGHDLTFGTATFARAQRPGPVELGPVELGPAPEFGGGPAQGRGGGTGGLDEFAGPDDEFDALLRAEGGPGGDDDGGDGEGDGEGDGVGEGDGDGDGPGEGATAGDLAFLR